MGLSTRRFGMWQMVTVAAVLGLIACGNKSADKSESKQKRASATKAGDKGTGAANDNKKKSKPPGNATDSIETPNDGKTLTGLAAFASAEFVDKLIKTRDSDHWYGLYLRGQKAGYAQLRMRKTKAGEPGAFMARISLMMKADNDKMDFKYISYFEGKAPYNVVAMEVVQKSKAGSVVRKYTPSGDKTKVESIEDGKPPKTMMVAAMCDTLDVMFAQMVPNLDTLQDDSKAEYCTFDTDKHKQDTDELRVAERSKRMINGVSVKVVKLMTKGKTEKVWQSMIIAEGGTTLEMAFGEGMKLKLEDKKIAQSNVTGVDVSSMAIKVKKPLGDPQKIKELKMIVKVTKGFEIPTGPNQVVKKRADGRYDVTIRSIPGPKVMDKDRAESLKATADINSDDPKIIALAKKLSASAKSPRDKVTALNHWVFKTLRKTLSTNLTTASQVLEHKAGDCTEHSVLLVALARALKIPAREVGGVIYDNEYIVGFGWHAWVEVELDGRWVQVDPSWDEPVGNATHLKLGAGDKDEGSANMGSLGIEIVYPVN